MDRAALCNWALTRAWMDMIGIMDMGARETPVSFLFSFVLFRGGWAHGLMYDDG